MSEPTRDARGGGGRAVSASCKWRRSDGCAREVGGRVGGWVGVRVDERVLVVVLVSGRKREVARRWWR